MSRKFLLCLIATLVATCYASPQIDQITPQALKPGATTILTFSGSSLADVTELWTSFGATAQRTTNSNPDQVSFEVECPSSACGIGALQLISPRGISNYQLVFVDSLPSEPPPANHHNLTNAQILNPPVSIDCILKNESIDYYKFHGTARQVFSIEVLAHRLGSQMDPVVKVLNASGTELFFCDDEGGTSRDSRFQFTCPGDGDYFLAVHDVGYGGGNAFDYRLRIGGFPLIWFTYPLEPIEDASPELFGLGIAGEEQAYCNAEPRKGLLEQEPNNGNAQAQVFLPPALLNGKFQYSGDVDCYKFTAEKNQKLIFQGATRSLGSPADLVLRLTKEDSTLIKQGDLSGANEGSLTNTFGDGGNYYLQVRELSGVAGSNLPYQIEVRNAVPGFTLSCEDDKTHVAPGAETTLKIICTRFDYDGPITLELLPKPSRIDLENNTIAEKKNEVELKIKASDQCAPGFFAHFKIVGTAKTKLGPFTNDVSTAAALKKTFPLILYPNRLLDGLFSLAVKEK